MPHVEGLRLRGSGVTLQPYFSDADVTLYHGDCIEVLREMADASVDSVVCDPPYALEFMGKQWDGWATPKAFQAWCGEWATECLRVLKPGGHLLAFGGSRTWHRLAAAVEDSGFELRDSIAWLYGSGFPKSLDVSKAIDKVAPRANLFEPFAAHFKERWDASGLTRRDFVPDFPHYKNADSIMAQLSNWKLAKNVPSAQDFAILRQLIGISAEWAPLIHRVEAEREATGRHASGLRTGDSGVGGGGEGGDRFDEPVTDGAKQWEGWGTALKPAFEPVVVARKPLVGTVAQNVTQYGTGALNIDGCRIEGRERTDYGLANAKRSQVATYGNPSESADFDASQGRWPPNVVLDETAAAELDRQSGVSRSPSTYIRNFASGNSSVYPRRIGDPAGAASVNYGDSGGASRFFPVFKYTAKAGSDERPEVDGVRHPTVKPIDLMRWLIRLVTPPNGLILDPFAGSGTTGEAAVLEHMHAILIEREPDYLPLIVQRLTKPIEVGFDFETAA